MQGPCIRGLVRLVDRVRRGLAAPLTERRNQRLPSDMPRAIATGDDLVRENRLAIDEWPGSRRKAQPRLLGSRLSTKSELVKPHKIWIEQCEAARGIEDQFGTANALDYLIGEKFVNFLEAAEDHPDFRAEVPAFVAEIKRIFERWQLAEYLETARQTEPFDPSLYDENEDEDEEMEMDRQDDIRQCARDLLLVERAKWYLLDDGEG